MKKLPARSRRVIHDLKKFNESPIPNCYIEVTDTVNYETLRATFLGPKNTPYLVVFLK